MKHPVRALDTAVAAIATAVFLIPGAAGDRLVAQSAVHPLAEAPSYGDLAPAVEYARAILETMRTERGTPGLSAAVGADGRLVWAEGFGWADVENAVPATEDTRFRIGSVSKPLTAAAMGILIDEGELDLDAPVQQYVPSFPEKPWPVTSRVVAGHLAGIRHYDGEEFLSTRRYGSVAEGLEIFAADDLLFEPGARFRYSSYGWNLLSAVVEGASGEDFLRFMDARVFDPLGMTSTVADHTDSIIPHRTRFYEVANDGRVYNSPFVDNSYKWAGGGFLSTPSDLVRFGLAHLDGQLLRPETIEMMWTSQRTTAGEETDNGVGWFLETKPDGRQTVSHGGGSIGGVTYLLLLPGDGAVAALTANTSQGVGLHRAAYLLIEAFLEPSSVVTLPDPAVAATWAGSWSCDVSYGGTPSAQAELHLVERGGRIAGFGGWEILRDDEEDVMTEISVAWSDPETSRLGLVTVDDHGNPTHITLNDSGASATGTWFDGNGGELSCTHEAP
jgi:CubicO group peptidase (beta-lactamase class C family)